MDIFQIVFGSYVLTYVMSYVLLKRMWIEEFKNWTKGDRRITLLMSLLGPFALIVAFFMWIESRCKVYAKRLSKTADEPAKW